AHTYTLSLHDALPISERAPARVRGARGASDHDGHLLGSGRMTDFLRRVSLFCAIALTIALLLPGVMPSAGQVFGGDFHRRAHMRSEEHTSELQSRGHL